MPSGGVSNQKVLQNIRRSRNSTLTTCLFSSMYESVVRFCSKRMHVLGGQVCWRPLHTNMHTQTPCQPNIRDACSHMQTESSRVRFRPCWKSQFCKFLTAHFDWDKQGLISAVVQCLGSFCEFIEIAPPGHSRPRTCIPTDDHRLIPRMYKYTCTCTRHAHG